MWSAISGVGSAIISGFSRLFSAATSNPRAAVAVIGGFLIFSAGFYSGHWYRGRNTQKPDPTKTGYSDEPLEMGYFSGGTSPESSILHPPPDSGRIDTVEVRVPEYVKADTVFRSLPDPSSTRGYATPDIRLRTRLRSNPYGFLLLPTPDGRPSIYVSERRTEVRALDPRDASSVRLKYPHPNDAFSAGPLVRLSGTRTTHIRTEGVLGAWIRYRALRLGGGYRFSAPTRTGPTLSLEWSPSWL